MSEVLKPVNLECLQEDHIELAQMIAELGAALSESSVHEAELSERLNALLEHCIKHFKCEEMQMEKFAYPAIAQHQREHERLLVEAAGVQAQWQDTQEKAMLQHYLQGSLMPWLFKHVADYDVEMADFIVAAGGS